jgi:hypothetical protein
LKLTRILPPGRRSTFGENKKVEWRPGDPQIGCYSALPNMPLQKAMKLPLALLFLIDAILCRPQGESAPRTFGLGLIIRRRPLCQKLHCIDRRQLTIAYNTGWRLTYNYDRLRQNTAMAGFCPAHTVGRRLCLDRVRADPYTIRLSTSLLRSANSWVYVDSG